jgi:D-glycero-alpha-D-manno-heptose 1-phosphate guanylyltransferase
MDTDVIILAGGLGTRLRPAVSDMPKCMAPVDGKPFLYYLLLYLSRFSFVKRIILSLGYRYEIIIDWLNQLHEFGFEYVYSIEETPLGTGGAIKKALTRANKDVLILNGDTLFDIDLNLFVKQHSEHNTRLSIALKPMKNFERYGNVEVNDLSIITAFKEKECCSAGQINGGIYLLSDKDLMSRFSEKFSFETDVLRQQVNQENIYGFIYNDYFIDIGIPEDYAKASSELKPMNFFNMDITGYETLFLDRDGIINRLQPDDYVKSWDEFEFLPGIPDVLSKWSKQFRHIIIVTNQRGVGKGLMTEKELIDIHTKMLEEIESCGGRIDKVYYCTAISDDDINRKPNIGMALQAKRDFPDIDFSKSLMIGDSETDEMFAENLGMKMICINRTLKTDNHKSE